MTRKYTNITKDIIEKVRDLKDRYPKMSGQEISQLTGWASPASVCRILNGDYDHLLDGEQETNNSTNVSVSILTEEVRTFREQFLEVMEEQHQELMEVMIANNSLLADIATMITNKFESIGHQPSKASESHFRDKIKSNRVKK